MTKADIPCNKNCTKETGRTITCKFDGTCDKYIKWKTAYDAVQIKVNQEKKKIDVYYSEFFANKGNRSSKCSARNNLNGAM